jgi:hypothetical protein
MQFALCAPGSRAGTVLLPASGIGRKIPDLHAPPLKMPDPALDPYREKLARSIVH